MKCANCGAELSEDSIFCENCGHKVSEDVVYCTNCGRKFSSQDRYCDYCGTRLTDQEEEERQLPAVIIPAAGEKKEKKKKNPKGSGRGVAKAVVTAAVAAVLIIAAVVLAAAFTERTSAVLTGGGKSRKIQSQVLYYQDDELYMTDLDTEEGPAKITDELSEEGESPSGLIFGDAVQVGRSYLFYPEKMDGSVFDLYRRKLSGKEGAEALKIDSNVSQYRVLKDDRVLYVKRDSLYYFDGADSVRFGKNVGNTSFQTDEAEKKLFWSEDNGEGGYSYYCQDLDRKSEKVELDDGAKTFFANKALTGFIELKYDNLYQVDGAGNKKRIAGNVSRVISCGPETGAVYYLTEGSSKAAYEDVIYEDLSMSEDDRAQLSRMGRFELPYMELHYYDGNQDHLISDRFYEGGELTGICDSRNGTYCLYREGPKPGELQVNWSRFRDVLENEDFGARVLNQAAADGLFSNMKLAIGGKTFGELKNVDNETWTETSFWEEGVNTLYVLAVERETEEGILYKAGLSGSGAGQWTEVDSDVFGFGGALPSEEGIYYIKEAGPEGGDLFLNGEIVDYEVFRMWKLDDGTLVYLTDWEYDSGGEGGYATLMTMNGGEKRLMMDDVSFADAAQDGTFLILADYDFARAEGDLYFYDGREKRKLSGDVAGFVPRNDSIRIKP